MIAGNAVCVVGTVAAMVVAAADGNAFAEVILRPVADIGIDKVGQRAGEGVIDRVRNILGAFLFGFTRFECFRRIV